LDEKRLSALHGKRRFFERYCAAMSKEPADLVRAAERAFNGRAVEEFVVLCHPEIEWETGLLGTPTYTGREGVRPNDP
jgi:hypothetical protein